MVSQLCNENIWLLKLELQLTWSYKSVPFTCLNAILSGWCWRIQQLASEGQDGCKRVLGGVGQKKQMCEMIHSKERKNAQPQYLTR